MISATEAAGMVKLEPERTGGYGESIYLSDGPRPKVIIRQVALLQAS